MDKNKKIKTALTVALALLLIGVLVFAVMAFADLRREAEQIAAQPGSSGVDFLGVALATSMLVIMLITLALPLIDCYISLMYFLTSQKRTVRKRIMNSISLVLSVISMLSVLIYFVVYLDVLLIIGFFWALALPLYRLVYCCLTIGKS